MTCRRSCNACSTITGRPLARLLSRTQAACGDSQNIVEELAGDELVSSLLLLHGLHPADLSSRIEEALERVRPFLQSHGGNVELVRLVEGVVHLRLQGSCHGCPSSAATLKSRIEQAIFEAAPDVAGIQVEDDAAPTYHAQRVCRPGAAVGSSNSTRKR